MLPKFLIAENSHETPEFLFVVHNENPRCIIESHVSDFNYLQEVHWIDKEPEDSKAVRRLIAEAKEFWKSELATPEDEFEDEDDKDNY